METTGFSGRLPFFEVEPNPIDDRYGSIRVCDDRQGPMAVLDYFHGLSDEIFENSRLSGRPGSRQAFFITRFLLSEELSSSTLERALLYIAACIADKAGEEVMYCRPKQAGKTARNTQNLWEIHGVRQQLDNYGALVQQL